MITKTQQAVSKQAHTPGPWIVGNRNNIITDIAPADYRKAVATVWTHDRDAGDPKSLIPNPEGEANARLIASAPDLLAALEALRGDLLRYPNDDARREQIIDAADAAIAKARGK